jgi:hypothetical protein
MHVPGHPTKDAGLTTLRPGPAETDHMKRPALEGAGGAGLGAGHGPAGR